MVYDSFDPPHILDIVKQNVEQKYYDKNLLEDYTEEEWDKINKFIDPKRDEDFIFFPMEQFRGKYLVQNRVTGEIKETPQVAYILISATLLATILKKLDYNG